MVTDSRPGMMVVEVRTGAGEVARVHGMLWVPSTGKVPVMVMAPGVTSTTPLGPAVNGPADTGPKGMAAGWPSVSGTLKGRGVEAALRVDGVAWVTARSATVTEPVREDAPRATRSSTRLAGSTVVAWKPVTVSGAPAPTVAGDDASTVAPKVWEPRSGTAQVYETSVAIRGRTRPTTTAGAGEAGEAVGRVAVAAGGRPAGPAAPTTAQPAAVPTITRVPATRVRRRCRPARGRRLTPAVPAVHLAPSDPLVSRAAATAGRLVRPVGGDRRRVTSVPTTAPRDHAPGPG